MMAGTACGGLSDEGHTNYQRNFPARMVLSGELASPIQGFIATFERCSAPFDANRVGNSIALDILKS